MWPAVLLPYLVWNFKQRLSHSYRATRTMDCAGAIPANPDISGVGVRTAIYAQTILSFVPAFYALKDGKISLKELDTIEKQSTTILITAFAVLISAIVQAATIGLSSFHTSIILNLSWMNNTNTFIYFLLYIHHKSDPERRDERVEPQWSAWRDHILQALRPPSMPKADIETNCPPGELESHAYSITVTLIGDISRVEIAGSPVIHGSG